MLLLQLVLLSGVVLLLPVMYDRDCRGKDALTCGDASMALQCFYVMPVTFVMGPALQGLLVQGTQNCQAVALVYVQDVV